LGLPDHKTRAVSQSIFATVASVKPKMHCFGHIHESWGAKIVGWRQTIDENPTHVTAIDNDNDNDNDRSNLIESLVSLRVGKFNTPEPSAKKVAQRESYDDFGFCTPRSPLRTSRSCSSMLLSRVRLKVCNLWVVKLDIPTSG
jgi:hypothetical protein